MNSYAARINAANALTILRILLVPVLVFALIDQTVGDLLAAGVFAVASLTDALDGYLARSRNLVTQLGTQLDPLADKLLIIAPVIVLVALDRLALWVALVIVAREVAVTILRVIATKRGLKVAASIYGKAKTVLQVTMVFMLIVVSGSPTWLDILIYITVAATVISGLDYFYKVMVKQEDFSNQRV